MRRLRPGRLDYSKTRRVGPARVHSSPVVESGTGSGWRGSSEGTEGTPIHTRTCLLMYGYPAICRALYRTVIGSSFGKQSDRLMRSSTITGLARTESSVGAMEKRVWRMLSPSVSKPRVSPTPITLPLTASKQHFLRPSERRLSGPPAPKLPYYNKDNRTMTKITRVLLPE